MLGLSFLGPSEYRPACYYWISDENPITYETDLFPEALARIFPLSKILVLVTEEVKKHDNCLRLKTKLGNLMETVQIPSGKSENELWDIFSIVADRIPSRARLLVDITHAFRALPLIVFNVSSYLRRIKNIKVERIVYGNFEARDNSFNPPRVPIFDITPTLDLQDWLYGIDAFQRRGNAEELANSLSRTQGRLYQENSLKRNGLPQKLHNTAKQLKNFSEALRLIRPLDTTSYAAKVCDLLDAVQDEATLWTKPFADVLHDIKDEISPLQHRKSNVLNQENLQSQLRLIQYYLDKDLIVQAVLLSREWLVSMLMFRTNRCENWRNKNVRGVVEKEVGLVTKVAVQKIINKNAVELPFWYWKDPQSKDIATIWDKLSSLRNDIAHCAMNTDAATANTIRSKIKELIPSMEALLNSHA